MSDENSSVLKIMALGRPFQLGMLYDLRNDKLIPSMTLWNSELISSCTNCGSLPSSSCEIHTDDTFTKKADLLGMDANLTMSALTDLVELSRSAQLINDRRTTKHKRRFILKYSVATRLHELTMTRLNKTNAEHQEIFDQQIATHVVTDILYGAEVYFIFDRTLVNGENHENIDRSVIKLLEKITTLRLFDKGQFNLEDAEEKIAKLLTCQYYGDFDLNFNPTTFEEAAKLFKELPKLLGGNQENIVPKQVWIYPLHLLNKFNLINKRIRRINNELASKSLKLIERLYRLEITVNDLKNSLTPSKLLRRSEQQWSMFYNHLHEFETDMKQQMKNILPKIRGGDMEETVLTNLLEKNGLFLTNKKELDNWIQFQTEGVRILIDLFNDLEKQVNINMPDFSLLDDQNNSDCESTLRLIIHVTEKKDPFLNKIFEYLNDNISKQNDPNTKIDCWFNQDKLALIQNKIASFSEFAKVNNTKQNVEFIAEERYADEFQMKKGVSILLYQNGTSTEFEIPDRPGQPRATIISSQSVTLNWTEPTDGSQQIQQYKIYGQINTNTEWTLFSTTTDAAPSVVISNLDKGQYQFKIQGITLAGDTVQSDVSDVIGLTRSVEARSSNLPGPLSGHINNAAYSTPQVSSVKSTATVTKVSVTPVWLKEIKVTIPIRYPPTVTPTTKIELRRSFDTLAKYRTVRDGQQNKQVDFVAEPFTPSEKSTETLVVILDMLAQSMGMETSLATIPFNYKDSTYCAACGVATMATLPLLSTDGDGPLLTATFNIKLDLSYEAVTLNKDTVEDFVLSFVNDITKTLGCSPEYVRVFEIVRGSTMVKFGLTMPDLKDTQNLAQKFQHKGRQQFPADLVVLKYSKPDDYPPEWKPVLEHLHLQPSDFEPSRNRDYSNWPADDLVHERGSLPYYLPVGWFRHALCVIDKYGKDDTRWLGMINGPNEWCVAYHGTKDLAVKSIVDSGLKGGRCDEFRPVAVDQVGSKAATSGIYLGTHCTKGSDAERYAQRFTVKKPQANAVVEEHYRIVFQCRVRPDSFTIHEDSLRDNQQDPLFKELRVVDKNAIRPYGILLRKVT